MNNLLKHPVISAVIAGLILSFLAWFSGFLPGIWQWVQDITNSVFSFVSQDITLPLWIIIIIIIPLLKWTYTKIDRYLHNNKLANAISSIDESPASGSSPIELTEDEQRIMKLLVGADGKALKPSSIRYSTGLPNLKLQQILEALEDKELIEIYSNDFDGTSIYLTKEGRDLMMGNEYASA